jgi:hypothetical protein
VDIDAALNLPVTPGPYATAESITVYQGSTTVNMTPVPERVLDVQHDLTVAPDQPTSSQFFVQAFLPA